MTTLAANRLTEALSKAKKVGTVEEGVTIMGCPIVLQTLRPQDYEDILAGIEDLEDVTYYNAYQLEHVSRALIEIDGHDLRDVEFIEDEAPAGFLVWATVPNEELAQKILKGVEQVGGEAAISVDETKRTVKYERHEWVKKHILADWGREALVVAWHKFAELLVTADEQARDGIEFRIPDETSEDKMRRLIGELSATFEGLPPELVDKVLKDGGLMRSTATQEMKRATDRIDKLAQETAAAPVAGPPAGGPPGPSPGGPQPEAPTQAPSYHQRVPEPPQPAAQPAQKPTPEPAPAGPTPTAQELMQRRQPLNRMAVQAPVPAGTETNPTPAAPRAAVPDQLREAAQRHTAAMGGKRSAQIAELEGQVDPALVAEAETLAQQQPMPKAEDVPVLQKADPFIPGETAKIINQPPVAGFNPRFKPPSR